MDRREAILSITTVLGYSVTPASITALSSACQRPETPTSSWVPDYFSSQDAGLIEMLGEAMLPKTETAGSIEVGAHLFVDRFLAEVASERDQKNCEEGLQYFKGDLESLSQKSGTKVSVEGIANLLTQYFEVNEDKQSAINTAVENKGPTNQLSNGEFYLYSFLMTFKRLLMLGYFASEQIGEEVLSYLPVPGSYQGCIPAEDVGNAWAL